MKKSVTSIEVGLAVLALGSWSCSGSRVEPNLNDPTDTDRAPPPSQALAASECNSSVPGASVGVREVDGGSRVVDLKIGPQELSGLPCRGRRVSGTASSE